MINPVKKFRMKNKILFILLVISMSLVNCKVSNPDSNSISNSSASNSSQIQESEYNSSHHSSWALSDVEWSSSKTDNDSENVSSSSENQDELSSNGMSSQVEFLGISSSSEILSSISDEMISSSVDNVNSSTMILSSDTDASSSSSSSSVTTVSVFKYDSIYGFCVNSLNEIGFNEFVLEDIKGTKNGECFNFPDFYIILLKEGVFEETGNLFAYDTLYDWNFKGSVLDSAVLYFAHIANGNFEGAQISNMRMGYASITGLLDTYSNVGGCPNKNDNTFYCSDSFPTSVWK